MIMEREVEGMRRKIGDGIGKSAEGMEKSEGRAGSAGVSEFYGNRRGRGGKGDRTAGSNETGAQ